MLQLASGGEAPDLLTRGYASVLTIQVANSVKRALVVNVRAAIEKLEL